MANPDSIALAARAETEGLETVLVGGNAVNLHSYYRTTFDVDLLVRETDSERWLGYFQGHGYGPFHRTPNFIRLRFVAAPAEALPVFDACRRANLCHHPGKQSSLRDW